MRHSVCQFLAKLDNFDFFGPNLHKNGYWSRNFKNLSLDSKSTPPQKKIPCVPILSQNRQLLFFLPKFGEIAQLSAIFWFKYCWRCCRELDGGCNVLGGGGWSWVEVEMSWVELGARFSNTLLNFWIICF